MDQQTLQDFGERDRRSIDRFKVRTGHFPWDLLTAEQQPRIWTKQILELLSSLAKDRSFSVDDRKDFPSFQHYISRFIRERLDRPRPGQQSTSPTLHPIDIKRAREEWAATRPTVVRDNSSFSQSASVCSNTLVEDDSDSVIIVDDEAMSDDEGSPTAIQGILGHKRKWPHTHSPHLPSPAQRRVTQVPIRQPDRSMEAIKTRARFTSKSLEEALGQAVEAAQARQDSATAVLRREEERLSKATQGLGRIKHTRDVLDRNVSVAERDLETAIATAKKAEQALTSLKIYLSGDDREEAAVLRKFTNKLSSALREKDEAGSKLDDARYQRDKHHSDVVASLVKTEREANESAKIKRVELDAMAQSTRNLKMFRWILILGPARMGLAVPNLGDADVVEAALQRLDKQSGIEAGQFEGISLALD